MKQRTAIAIGLAFIVYLIVSPEASPTAPARFQKGDVVTFSDTCPEEFREPFKDGPRPIEVIHPDQLVPVGVQIIAYYHASDLKLVKKGGKK